MKDLPKTITQTLRIYALKSFVNGEYQLTLSSIGMSGLGSYILLGTTDVTVDVPQDVNIINREIESLEGIKDQILTEAHLKAEEITEQIQSLQALEHLP